MTEDFFEKLKEEIAKEKKIIGELGSLSSKSVESSEEKKMILLHKKNLNDSLNKTGKEVTETLEKIFLARALHKKEEKKLHKEIPVHEKKLSVPEKKLPEVIAHRNRDGMKKSISSRMGLSNIEKTTLKRLKKKEKKIVEIKIKKPSKYIKTANKYFADWARAFLKEKTFSSIGRDLIKTNLEFTPQSYVATMMFTIAIAIAGGFVMFLFLLFFNLSLNLPIISLANESIGARFLKTFWLVFAIPLGTFLFMYFYPSLERKSAEYQIDQELPFATIHMSSIAESRLEPSRIFSIIISTKEYPYIEKEFTKLINEINIYGYDLVTALRSVALKTPSRKLSELFNSLATTINSGGDLPIFFSKRAQSLLFEYRLEREKYTKTAETFMDIYISVVIAAPMILMLLLMMMRISGLGISLSSSMITLVMVLGVSLVNIIFLTFLHLKQPGA